MFGILLLDGVYLVFVYGLARSMSDAEGRVTVCLQTEVSSAASRLSLMFVQHCFFVGVSMTSFSYSSLTILASLAALAMACDSQQSSSLRSAAAGWARV